MGFLSRGFQDLAALNPTVKDINFDLAHIPLLQQHNLLLYICPWIIINLRKDKRHQFIVKYAFSFTPKPKQCASLRRDPNIRETLLVLWWRCPERGLCQIIKIHHHWSWMIPSQVQYYVIQYKPKAATWDYKEISGAITNFYDIRGLRWGEVDILRGNNLV